MKNEVCEALEGVEITDSGFANRDNIVINFGNGNARNEAAQKFEIVEQFCTIKCWKIKAKDHYLFCA